MEVYHLIPMKRGPKKQTCVIIHNYGSDNPWLLHHISIISRLYQSTLVILTSKTQSSVIIDYRLKGYDVFVLQNSLTSVFALFKLVIKFRPDLFSHGLRPTQISFLLGIIFNLRLIIFQHYSPNILNFSQHFRSRFSKFPNVFLLKMAIRYSDFVFVFSKEVFRDLMGIGINPAKMRLTPLGIASMREGESNKRWLNKQSFQIIVVGRLSVEKNLFLALDILNELKILGFRFSARFFGSGPLELSLCKYASKLDLNQSVSFEGWVPNLHEVYLNSDVLLHTSWTEGYGQVFIEALEAGLKIFSTKVGVIEEMLDFKIECVKTFDTNHDRAEIAKSLAQFISQDTHSCEAVSDFLHQHSFSQMQKILEFELHKLFKIDD
jgi:glycosyltransferase involved in cell wall biosynthesis